MSTRRGPGLALLTEMLLLALAIPRSGRSGEGSATPSSRPVPAAQAPARMKVPEGFAVSLFAAEPEVVQPIAFAIDPRGRLWVVENYSYPVWLGGPQGKDRILILEDADGDGKLDRRTVFFDKGTNLTGIELGFGGVWVCATPNMLFIPDRDGDDKADGTPEVVLDGWDTKAQHNMFNALKWGPDGWLWGCNGILSNSRVGNPGTPENRRVPINCGVWRYHPTRKVFEAVAHGTTNPWGLDFDDHGEAFITNCVIAHLFHVVPGAHFQRMFGQDYNPNLYSLMQSCADHLHWAGGRWQDSREGKGQYTENSAVGGGHAHVGAMIYLGDNWPDRYRDQVYTFNIHGHRVNRDRLDRKGSSYIARHQPDFLLGGDTWFRGLELKYGPDGAVYFTDWSDMGECHETDSDNAHRENGRIYKLRYGTLNPVKVDLSKQTGEELANLQLHKNDWYVRSARRLLQERTAAGKDMRPAHRVLRSILETSPDPTRRLRALWTLDATGGMSQEQMVALLQDRDEFVRAWAVRILVDRGAPVPELIRQFSELARTDPSARVRLNLASALQRIPEGDRWLIGEAMVSHSEDVGDPMLPLMVWFGLEPLAAADPARAAALAGRCKLPIVRNFLARRAVSSDPAAGLAAFTPLLRDSPDALRRDLLAGIREALRGRRQVPRPAGWPELFTKLMETHEPDVLELGLLLSLELGEPKAVEAIRLILADRSMSLPLRSRALAGLVERRVPGLSKELHALLDDRDLRPAAIRALAAYNDPNTPEVILRQYSTLTEAERDDALATLSARPAWAIALLDNVAGGKVPRKDLNATVARQLLALNQPSVNKKLEAAWGKVRPTSTEKAPLLARYKTLLASDQHPAADPGRGRQVFNRTCLACHRLFDSGGDVGPDLTGSDRANTDYILENVLDPSAAVAKEYTLSNLATSDGRMVSGIIREQNDRSVTVQTTNERILLPREDIEAIKPSTVSMMPEGQLERLSPQEIRDLFAYLAASTQVPAPATAR